MLFLSSAKKKQFIARLWKVKNMCPTNAQNRYGDCLERGVVVVVAEEGVVTVVYGESGGGGSGEGG